MSDTSGEVEMPETESGCGGTVLGATHAASQRAAWLECAAAWSAGALTATAQRVMALSDAVCRVESMHCSSVCDSSW